MSLLNFCNHMLLVVIIEIKKVCVCVHTHVFHERETRLKRWPKLSQQYLTPCGVDIGVSLVCRRLSRWIRMATWS